MVSHPEGVSLRAPINFLLTQLDTQCQHAHFKPDVCPTSKLGYGPQGVGPMSSTSDLVFYVELVDP